MRSGNVERKTLETGISAEWCLDGSGSCEINTGIGFFDHMLTLLAKHSFSDLVVHAVGDKAGIHRYGNCFLPMDEALVQVCLDFSGRPYLVFDADIPKVQLGIYDAEMTEEFFRALAMQAGLTLHIRVLYGKNTHHIIEAIFKGFARALAEAVAFDSRVHGVMSSKGTL